MICSSVDDLQGGIRCKSDSWNFSEWLTSPELGTSLQQYVDEGGLTLFMGICALQLESKIINGAVVWVSCF